MITSIISDQLSMDFEEALRKAKDYFRHVEIHSLWNKTIEDLDEEEAREVERLLKKHSMKVSCLSTTLFLMCPLYTDVDRLEKFSDTFLVYTGDFANHMDRLRRCVEMSKRFGTDSIRVFPFRLEQNVKVGFGDLVNEMAEKLGEAVSYAEKNAKLLIIENCPHSYLPRGNMTFELANRIKSPNFKLLYDAGNSFKSELLYFPQAYKRESILEEYEKIKGQVRHFHFKDYRKTGKRFTHAVFSEGDVGYRELYALIEKDRGDWCVSLEPEIGGEGVVKSIRNFFECAGIPFP
jgi:sugar phosphate isomerase/epimerase